MFTMEFAALLAAGETISSVSSAVVDLVTSPILTVGAPAASGSQVTVRLSGGVTNNVYKLTVIVVTSAGNTLEGEGLVQCENL